jgi:dipeptidase
MRPVYDGGNPKYSNQYPRSIDTSVSPIYVPTDEFPEGSIAPIGHVPQVEKTYARWEGSYGLLNEKGLGFGESTCAAKLLPKGNAIMSIRALMEIGLERCSNARCAIKTMGDVAEKYGFIGEDPGQPGAGEALTITDTESGEAWVFHIMSDGEVGAVWVAQRVPEGNVAVVANDFTIKEIDFSDTGGKEFLFSSNIREVATREGLWDGRMPFNWQQHFGEDIRYFSYTPGAPPIPRYTTLRLWRVFTRVAPSFLEKPGWLDGEVSDNPAFFPFSVKAEVPVPLSLVQDIYREHYEGTKYDLRLGVFAGPFGNPNRIEGGASGALPVGGFSRAISIQRTTYVSIVHAKRQKAAKGTNLAAIWFAPDAGATSVGVPFYAATLFGEPRDNYAVAEYGFGNRKDFDFSNPPKAAWWAHDFVANWMERNYQNMSEGYVYPEVHRLQNIAYERSIRLEQAATKASDATAAAALLEAGQTEIQRYVATEFWRFAGNLLVLFNDNFLNFPKDQPRDVVHYGYPLNYITSMLAYEESHGHVRWDSTLSATKASSVSTISYSSILTSLALVAVGALIGRLSTGGDIHPWLRARTRDDDADYLQIS